MDTQINLNNGGKCVVMMGHNGFVQEFANNPQVQFVDCKKILGADLNETIKPENLKVVILTEGIPNYHQAWMTTLCSRKRIPYLVRKTNAAIYEQLKSFFPEGDSNKPSVDEVKEEASRGRLQVLIPDIDFSKSNSENARNLLRICTDRGIKSTFGSLSQFVAIQRRKKSGTALPKSSRSKLDVSVEMLDDAIKGLTDLREYLISTTEENRLLKAKLDRFKKAMDD